MKRKKRFDFKSLPWSCYKWLSSSLRFFLRSFTVISRSCYKRFSFSFRFQLRSFPVVSWSCYKRLSFNFWLLRSFSIIPRSMYKWFSFSFRLLLRSFTIVSRSCYKRFPTSKVLCGRNMVYQNTQEEYNTFMEIMKNTSYITKLLLIYPISVTFIVPI